jgi:tRNA dimethylallyltransferase
VVIVGPTGSGKSDTALALARSADGEIVSADSQQVYRGMDIGTGKVTLAEREQVRHHLIDVLEPSEEMTAARFAGMADAAIADIAERGSVAVVAGGTGLYIRALLLGLFEGPAADAEIRRQLRQRGQQDGVVALWTELQKVDSVSAERIDPADEKRLVRALEVFQLTGVPLSEHLAQHDHRRVGPRYPHRIVCLCPEREELYERINRRVDEMVAAGLVEEIRGLREAGYGAELRSQQAIGYAEIHRVLDGDLEMDQAVALIKRNSRRYARRQLSWYRNGPAADTVEWYSGKSEVDLQSLKGYLRESDS